MIVVLILKMYTGIYSSNFNVCYIALKTQSFN